VNTFDTQFTLNQGVFTVDVNDSYNILIVLYTDPNNNMTSLYQYINGLTSPSFSFNNIFDSRPTTDQPVLTKQIVSATDSYSNDYSAWLNLLMANTNPNYKICSGIRLPNNITDQVLQIVFQDGSVNKMDIESNLLSMNDLTFSNMLPDYPTPEAFNIDTPIPGTFIALYGQFVQDEYNADTYMDDFISYLTSFKTTGQSSNSGFVDKTLELTELVNQNIINNESNINIFDSTDGNYYVIYWNGYVLKFDTLSADVLLNYFAKENQSPITPDLTIMYKSNLYSDVDITKLINFMLSNKSCINNYSV
jgi:hypothetical protein